MVKMSNIIWIIPVHGEWSGWAPWEGCSVSCDVGVKKRHRTCTNPVPSIYGHNCIGDAAEYNICHQPACSDITTTGNYIQRVISVYKLLLSNVSYAPVMQR